MPSGALREDEFLWSCGEQTTGHATALQAGPVADLQFEITRLHLLPRIFGCVVRGVLSDTPTILVPTVRARNNVYAAGLGLVRLHSVSQGTQSLIQQIDTLLRI